MRLKELEGGLQPLKGFAKSKRELEQYVTSAHLASRMIFAAESSFGDIDEKSVLDLGCGCAVLSIAAVMMGAESVLAVDMDVDALEIARGNIELVDMDDEITLVNAQLPSREPGEPVPNGIDDAIPILDPTKLDRKIDTVIMNPPFGTWNKGIDMVFLEVAAEIAETAIYSLHKSSTREFILKKAASVGFTAKVIAEMKYDLPNTMAHHKKKNVEIEVDLLRFERIAPRNA